MKKGGLLVGKILLWLVASIIILVVLVYALIQVPSVQNFARKKVVSFVQNKIKTKVEIDRLSLDLPKLLVLEGVYFEDQNRDTLLSGDTVKVDISLIKLLKSQIEINEIDLRGIRANVERTMPDSAFNFDYIIKAFIGEPKKNQPVDTTAGMKFSVSKINLDRINLTFKDAVSSNNVGFYLGHFDTKIEEFDLDKMKFTIPKIVMSGVNAKIIQTEPVLKQESVAKIEAESNIPFDINLKLGTVDLSKIKVNYQNNVSKIKSDINLGNLLAEVDSFNFKKQRVSLRNLTLNNTKSLVVLGKSVQSIIVVKEIGKEVEAQLNNNWKVTAAKLDFNNNSLWFDNFNLPVQRRGIDYAHLGISNLDVKAEDFSYSLDTIAGNVENISFRDKCGFVLNKLQTNFIYGNQGVTLNDLYIETPQSQIRNYVKVTYPSLEILAKNPGSMGIKANLVNSRLSLKDVLTFVPMLATLTGFQNLSALKNAVFNINGNVSGLLSNLNIPQLKLAGLTNTRINASGRITGLPDMNKANFNITLREFKSGSRDLNSLVSKGIIPSNIRLPENFNLAGTFNGGISSFKTNLRLNSNYGSAKAIAAMKAGKRAGAESFNADVQFANFNVGRLIRQEANIGRVTASGKIQGTGTDPKFMSAKFSAVAQKAELKKYAYRNLVLNGTIARQNVTAFAKMNDPNLKFNLNAKSNISGTYPSVDLVLDVDSVNFQALKLYNEDLRFRGKIIANMPSTNPDRLIGTVEASNLLVVSKGKRYQLDSVNMVAKLQGNQKNLQLRSEFLTANLIGEYKLTEIASVLSNEINKHFKIGDGRKLPVSSPHNFSFAANVTNRPILQTFLPQLTRLEPISIKGEYHDLSSLKVTGTAPQIVYNGNTIENLRFNLNSTREALDYDVNLDKISTASLLINKTTLAGKAKNNQVGINLNIRDRSDKNKYQVAGLFSALANQYQFSFNPNGLMLNYDNWAVAADNALQYGPGGIFAKNFVLSQSGQSLSINSNPQEINAPLSINFTNFKIETLTAIAGQDTLLAGGTINGNALVSNVNTNPLFTSDLTVKDFTFRTDTVGDISLKVNNQTANTYAAQINITGKGNDVALNGEYYLKPQNNSNFDFDLNIRNINLASVEGLTMGAMKDASGSINGVLKITGKVDNPSVRGDINFNQTAFNIAMLDSYYRINDEKVSFTAEGIRFDTFTIIDSAGNKAVADGIVYTTNFTEYRFGLDINTDNFKAVSSTQQDNKLFYGDVFLSSNLRIRGDMNSPNVDGNVRINDKTSFTIVLPQSAPGIVEREGIVEFVDMDDPESVKAFTSGFDTLNISDITGMDVALNIEVDSNAVFNIVVDQGTGDFLRIQGDAQLTAGIDPSGKVNMAGTFELTKGAYELSFNFLKRRFDIQSGSTITWTGEPTSADINVTAIYVANTAPFDLVQGQIDEPVATLNRYKQKLPFEVYLTMRGELLTPDISFDIGLPNRNYNVARDVVDNVQSRLVELKSEPSELNKQVFALLLLNRFVAENPFASGAGGGGASSIARNSVSSILSDQLNNLAGDLIQGVDINFDLVSTEDYTTGSMQNRTDLNVGLSKQLLNDRLKVSIGSNFELEGPQNTNQSSGNIAGNVALDYQLSKDGRYMLRVYRKNEYQGVVEGYLIETGMGFIITMDYTKFKEIFARKTEEDKKRQKIEKDMRKQEKVENKQVVNVDN